MGSQNKTKPTLTRHTSSSSSSWFEPDGCCLGDHATYTPLAAHDIALYIRPDNDQHADNDDTLTLSANRGVASTDANICVLRIKHCATTVTVFVVQEVFNQLLQ